MRALIIEDEKAAVRNLQALLNELAPEVELVAVLDSIVESLEWFQKREMPDLVFLDIHLADGSAFEIFEHVAITCPIIFTTAYDEYALRAFKVNSVDYLLKPIGSDDLRKAFVKLRALQQSESSTKPALPNYHSLIEALRREENFKTHFLIPIKGDKLLPVSVDSIGCFRIDGTQVRAEMIDGRSLFFVQTLDELTDCLDPQVFFRVNRQYLVARTAIEDLDLWFGGRLVVNLKVHVPDKILVSKARVTEFKDWLRA